MPRASLCVRVCLVNWCHKLYSIPNFFPPLSCLLAPTAAVGAEGGSSPPLQSWPPLLVPCGTDEEGTTHWRVHGHSNPLTDPCEQEPSETHKQPHQLYGKYIIGYPIYFSSAVLLAYLKATNFYRY